MSADREQTDSSGRSSETGPDQSETIQPSAGTNAGQPGTIRPPAGTDAGQSETIRPSLERLYARLPIAVPTVVRNAYHRLTLADDFEGYDHPPDPFAVRWVDPARIEAFTGRPYPPYRDRAAQLGTVRDGDWDRIDEPPIADPDYRERYDLYRAARFSESTFYESLRAHFEDGVDWEATPFVERCLALAARDEPSWHSLTSNEAILERCARIDDLYERIRAEGYRSQRALGEPSLRRVTDEVVVDIARDGTLLFVNGRHRLAIAKLLGLEAIPVGVLVRHAEWMRIRDAYAETGTVPDGLETAEPISGVAPGDSETDGRSPNHPDLRELHGSPPDR